MNNDYAEAKAILAGTSMMLPEKRHLEAIEEHLQCELIRLVYDIDQVAKAALKRN